MKVAYVGKFDEQPDFVYSTFELVHRYPSRSIEVCLLAALYPLSHLQAPRRIGGIFHSADGRPP